MLNRTQQAIVKHIALKKHINIDKPLCLFLIGGVGSGKTFTSKEIYQMMIRNSDAYHITNPIKPKGLILDYIRKAM